MKQMEDMRAQVSDILMKPVRPAELAEAVERVLGNGAGADGVSAD